MEEKKESRKKTSDIFLWGALCLVFCLLSFGVGIWAADKQPTSVQYCDENQHKMILNIGIAIGYLSSKQGINEEVLYSEGMKLYHLVAKPYEKGKTN